MREQEFREYLATLKSKHSGRRFSGRVIGNILSRCRTAEQLLGAEIEALVPEDAELSRSSQAGRGYDDLIPKSINADCRTAVRKYLDFLAYERRASS